MSDKWDRDKAKSRLKLTPQTLVCDALLDQNVFAGVGNIIKNEVLFRIRLHPESTVGALPEEPLNQLVDEARNYSFDFLKWKKNYELKRTGLLIQKRSVPDVIWLLLRSTQEKQNAGLSIAKVARFCIGDMTMSNPLV
jgi:endonuclease-8